MIVGRLQLIGVSGEKCKHGGVEGVNSLMFTVLTGFVFSRSANLVSRAHYSN